MADDTKLTPGQSYNDLRKAKIYDFASRKQVADLPSDKATGKPVGSVSVSEPEAKVHHGSDKPAKPAKETKSKEFGPHKGGPWAIKLREGFLVGSSPSSKKHSPCPNCVHNWLKDRGVPNEPSTPLKARKFGGARSVEEVSHKDHDPHVVHEVSGEPLQPVVMNARIDKHPSCTHCDEKNYKGPKHGHPAPNYAFTAWHKVQSARFGTPTGNLWVTTATHANGTVQHGVGSDKNESRHNAVHGIEKGQTGPADFMPTVGKLVKADPKGHLVVGANNYLRNEMPYFATQTHDHHIFHTADAEKHRVGIIAMSRKDAGADPIYVHAEGKTGQEAMTNAVHHMMLEHHKAGSAEQAAGPHNTSPDANAAKKNNWLTHAIYKMPKRALRDVLATADEPSKKMAKSLEPRMSYNDLKKKD